MFFAPALHTRTYAPARGIDRSFERFLNQSFLSGARFAQTDDAWTITLDVPGVAREHLTIDVDGAVVRLQTVADAPRQYKAAYELPEAIDAEATTAKLEHGVLVLTLAKQKPVSSARTIEIK